MYRFSQVAAFVAVFDNTIEAFIPELWANESLALLMENMVVANLVHRDFEANFAQFGDVVNTRRPADFDAEQKDVNDDVTIQNAIATNIPVQLNQQIHVSFLIRDGEESKSFKSLVDEFLRPAAVAMARRVDQIVLGQVYQFLENQAGGIGGLTSSNAEVYMTGTRNVMNNNKAWVQGRSLILTSNAETKLLQNELFLKANEVGDDGTALREASLGRKFGFDTYMSQNTPSVSSDPSTGSGAINGGNLTKGSTVLTVNGFASGEVVPGQWILLSGFVYHVTATDNATATQLTLEYGLIADILTAAPIVVYDSTWLVNQTVSPTGYAAGYKKHIAVDGTGQSFAVGMLVTFGTALDRYMVVKTNGTTYIELDRPLEVAIADEDAVNQGPGGNYNMAFHRNAISLVVRPLAQPRKGTGALSGVANFGGLSMRTTITYDGEKQGHLVTLDFLLGIKVLDENLGAVMVS
jgi:hypothetical protein